MKYLLDVNALIAYGFRRHSFHERVARWVQSSTDDRLLTCSLTELGFVRVLGNVRTYGMDVARAKDLLRELKTSTVLTLEFISDGNDVSFLPSWAKSRAQITDGHLVRLAKSHSAVLATLDRGIPGAHIIPTLIDGN